MRLFLLQFKKRVHPPFNKSGFRLHLSCFVILRPSVLAYRYKNVIHVGVGKYRYDVYSVYDDVFVCVFNHI